ncbi:AIPR family protein [Hymenobacter armeniacus]|uniref:AIPR family protein n=1 Tax=Hymenobacter armeniacus TaxID=2771358 RepID=UPI001CC25B62|nr:AIPR family protein [Hymenobacter armeniacus]
MDKVCQEAPITFKKYHPPVEDTEKVNQARARAFIHLYLKVSFGLLDFIERENYLTDDTFDGGIDGYYIDADSKTIYLIQSKFRTSESNFNSKEIELMEILAMDISRILDGENQDEKGNEYNGKIKQMIKKLSLIKDISRYRYEVVILANLSKVSNSNLKKLTDGYPAQVFDFEKSYNQLVYPVVSGTYFNATDLHISLDLSNKNSGSKISYAVETEYSKCEITVLFVPTVEVAKLMQKYKNSILKFNPRSYLEFTGRKVNNSIRESIVGKKTNEFALYNNGITMLSDESNINEKIGQKNKAQLTVTNPQIINGGQTSFTLSRILDEFQNEESIFENKEVLLKIITFTNEDTTPTSEANKLELIEAISQATNQQTTVTNADKVANSKSNIELQSILFNRYGIFYERKLGEFADGIAEGYINEKGILERNLFYKILYATQGRIEDAKQKRLFQKGAFDTSSLNAKVLDKFYFGYLSFIELTKDLTIINLRNSQLFSKIYASVLIGSIYDTDLSIKNSPKSILTLTKHWNSFEGHISTKPENSRFSSIIIDKKTSQETLTFNYANYFSKGDFKNDVIGYFTAIVQNSQEI